ncbi:hypothetical protein GMDG_08666 [Pseudogymnoascus destructans 20631-21]|uniref:Uncharacterized protein n=1 Tax=Pseudogymnoascus destructans (strain ATCC MYA-4855 / 20631-21) TaxID=658429 RepID=L8G9Y8_PSED2|nr:hypothetical protein GMDG_08666 [Pseudogymnoascus destructans 20631-21]
MPKTSRRPRRATRGTTRGTTRGASQAYNQEDHNHESSQMQVYQTSNSQYPYGARSIVHHDSNSPELSQAQSSSNLTNNEALPTIINSPTSQLLLHIQPNTISPAQSQVGQIHEPQFRVASSQLPTQLATKLSFDNSHFNRPQPHRNDTGFQNATALTSTPQLSGQSSNSTRSTNSLPVYRPAAKRMRPNDNDSYNSSTKPFRQAENQTKVFDNAA